MRATSGLVVFFIAVAVGVGASIALADPGQEGERYVSVEWQPDPNDGQPAGRKILIQYTYRGCPGAYRFHRASARETDKSVTIKVLAHYRQPPPDTVCPAVAYLGREVVRLKRPLGNRKLRHAPVTDGGHAEPQ